MDLTTALQALRDRNHPVPTPARLPSEPEVAAMEQTLGLSFPKDYRRFLLEGSDVNFGTLEPANILLPDSHTYLLKVLANAQRCNVPQDVLPFCEDNSDFFCLLPSGEVRYWSDDSNGFNDERWPNLAAWIMQVWIAESETS